MAKKLKRTENQIFDGIKRRITKTEEIFTYHEVSSTSELKASRK